MQSSTLLCIERSGTTLDTQRAARQAHADGRVRVLGVHFGHEARITVSSLLEDDHIAGNALQGLRARAGERGGG